MAGTSRVNREVYARFCGRLEVKFLRPTRQPRTPSTRACQPGAMGTKRSAMPAANTPATRTGTGSARSTSTRWKDFGPCCVPGCARTGAFRRTSCRFISASSSSCITHAGVAKPCSAPLLQPWSHDPGLPPRNPTRASPECAAPGFGHSHRDVEVRIERLDQHRNCRTCAATTPATSSLPRHN